MNASHHKKLLQAVAWLRERRRYVLDHAKNPDGNAVSWVNAPNDATLAVRREQARLRNNVTRFRKAKP